MTIWSSGRAQRERTPCVSCHETIYWDAPVYFQLHSFAPFCQRCYKKHRHRGDELLRHPSRSWTNNARAITSTENRDWSRRADGSTTK